MIHELKIWPQFYCRVLDGSKTFEVRDNDRFFQPGDTVVLKEYDPTPTNASVPGVPKGYTDAKPLTFLIGYVFPLSSDKVVFSLLPIKKPVAKAKKR